MLQVTPNGMYQKPRHPRLPVSPTEVLADLRGCFRSGATGVHLHPRDADGRESLDPGDVNPLVAAVRELARECGVDAEIGLTTRDVIIPDLSARIRAIGGWEDVDCATVNLSEDRFADVMNALVEVGVGVDVGLAARTEVDRFVASGLAEAVLRISIELSPDDDHGSSDAVRVAVEVNAALDDAGLPGRRLTHGTEAWTWPLVADAYRRGHDTRVGFEDGVRLPDGSLAPDNAALVSAAATLRGTG